MVHRGGTETSSEKNKKNDFTICLENAKTAEVELYDSKIDGTPSSKAKPIKRSVNKASPKSTPLPLSDHSISQTVVRVERSKFIKSKNLSNSKTDVSNNKSTALSPARAGLRSNSLESINTTNATNNNAKAKNKTLTAKKGSITKPIDIPLSESINPPTTANSEAKYVSSKSQQQKPLAIICSLPLERLSGILENLKIDTTSKCQLSNSDEGNCLLDDRLTIDQNSSQCKTLCLYCDKRMSTVKVRARHIERFHTLSKERRSSGRNPIVAQATSQDSRELAANSLPLSSSSSSSSLLTSVAATSANPSTVKSLSSPSAVFNGCSFCSKSPKLQAVALENDLIALFNHLVDLHSDKYFGCKLCAIRFQNAAKLGEHVQRAHAQSSKTTHLAENVNPPPSSETEQSPSEFGKSTPTKNRRQMSKQTVSESGRTNSEASSPTTKVALSASASASGSTTSLSQNGSLYASEEPILTRLGLTQNRLPRGRKGIRSRRQINVDGIKPEPTPVNVKTRSKVGRVITSSEPIETVFRTPTNTRIEPLSCTFDEDFYEKVLINVRTNLSCHLDGKLGNTLEEIRPQSPPPLMPAIRSTVVKSPHIVDSEVHTATSLSALTAFPTLLTAEQYGCDLGTTKIKRPITKHSWKWKWDSVKKYKYVNEGGKIVKKIKQPMLGLRDLSKLDMWTQLTMRQKHEITRKQVEATTSDGATVVPVAIEYPETSREEKQRQIDQLNMILDSRRLPQIIVEQNEQTIIKLEITDQGLRYLANELSANCLYDEPSTSRVASRTIPGNLNLIPRRSLGESSHCRTVVLSGEWARPRCYICFGCGARFDKIKALEEHKMFRHPHVYSTHYEIVGKELIDGNLYKHFFIPVKALSRHREYAQGMLLNKKTEDIASKSSSNSGNEEESLDSLHSVTASFTTISSSKLSDDCDTDTKTVIETISPSSLSFNETSTLSINNNSTSLAVASSFSVDCTKCSRNCHGVLELYRHMLDCSGDYAWILAKKKKYRYYGSRKRRQLNKHSLSALQQHRRKLKEAKDENESDETPKKKATNMSPSTPRPRPSDADSIRKMLENLPPKRVCREIIPNATKPRLRKFNPKTGKKIQNNPANKRKSSTAALAAMSKKLLRNHKRRAIADKGKVLRNNKVLEANPKSARNKTDVIPKKKAHLEAKEKVAKKPEPGKVGIVRKIRATTKRFVKKIKKRFLGAKEDNPTIEEVNKKPSKGSAVRKLSFDNQNETDKDVNKPSVECKKPNTIETPPVENKNEKEKSAVIENKTQVPTITVETEVEAKKSTEDITEDSGSLKQEGSMENLHENQHELSTSTEDLRKLTSTNQVSPSTKRRSKKINDCIAMLTGKLQEKLGKPFLECKESVEGDVKTNNISEVPTVPVTENSDTKLPKRKAFSRRIVKCDQPNEISVTSVTTASIVQTPPARVQIPELTVTKLPNMKPSPAVSTPLLVPMSEPSSAPIPTPTPSIIVSMSAATIPTPTPTLQPIDLPSAKPPTAKHSAKYAPKECQDYLIEMPKPKDLPPTLNQFIPVPAKRIPPPVITVEITTPPPVPVILKNLPKRQLPEQKLPQKSQCVINADTIRVPCVKPLQLTVPQFPPAQISAPRGMIAKRRQTIAGAPNDFLLEVNSLRCTNTHNNLPFELEVPLDLSKKPKRTSTGSETNPKTFPVPVPQISVKPNALLMPPLPFPLPMPLSQSQIIPMLCESLRPKVSQIPNLQRPPVVQSKEPVKPVITVTRKRISNNNNRQDMAVNSNIVPLPAAPIVSLMTDNPPPKKFPKKPPELAVKPDVIIMPEPSIPSMPSVLSVSRVPSIPVCDKPVVSTNATEQNALCLPLLDINNMAVITHKTAPPQSMQTIAKEVSSPVSCLPIPQPLVEAETIPMPIVANSSKDTPLQVSPKKQTPSSEANSATDGEQTPTEQIVKPENKTTSDSSPDSQKSLPTRRSKRNKASDQNDMKSARSDQPTTALKEVEEIAASFLSEDEQENTCEENIKLKSTKIEPKLGDKPKQNNENVVDKKAEESKSPLKEPSDTTHQQNRELEDTQKEDTSATPAMNHQDSIVSNNQDSNKKPRKRRKNELAAIVADQLLESFKEVDKSRIDDLKRLENLAYGKGEDLLLTGMRLMPTTKRKNVLENKKDINIELESKSNALKEPKKSKSDPSAIKEKSSVAKKDISQQQPEGGKDSKEIQQIDLKLKQSKVEADTTKITKPLCKDDFKNKPLTLNFSNYRTSSADSWTQRGLPQQISSDNEKSPNNDVITQKKNKKKQLKKRDKKIEIENINQLRTGLESVTLSKDLDNRRDETLEPQPRNNTEASLSVVGLFTSTQNNSIGMLANNETDTPSLLANMTNTVAKTSSILRPSILAATLDVNVTVNKENPPPTPQAERKSSISSRDPRLNKNIHTEDAEEAVPVTSRLATLRQRRRSIAEAPIHSSRTPSARSTPKKRSDLASRRSSLAFDDDEDDNYLTAIAKRVNDQIMSAEDKDFNLANDGFDLANSFLDLEDPFGRPSTSMSVRSAPNFNDDRSNMDTMDATNTDLIDMDVDDDMSVYTTFSQDTSRSKGRRRRRRRSVLLTRKPKKTNISLMESTITYDCLLCNKKFAKPAALNKHQQTLAHVTKVSEQEYLNATRKKQETDQEAKGHSQSILPQTIQEPQHARTNNIPSLTALQDVIPESIKPPSILQPQQDALTGTVEESIPSKIPADFPGKPAEKAEEPEKLAKIEKPEKQEKVEKPLQPKVPYIPPNSILSQSGIEPISSPEQNYERYSTKTTSRLTLNPDERLFYECCNILKGSETPLVERTYPLVPPSTYAFDLHVKPVTPKSTNERFSYIKQSTAEVGSKREGGAYPRIDVNQFSDISSDSNPACAQPPPVLPVNYAQMHVLSGAKDQADLPNDGGNGSTTLRSNAPRENPVLQLATLASPNPVAPLTARTFVNQPSQLGPHHMHGMESAATVTQKQNFISPLHSASSQSSTITTTTCRLKTKAAMKGYDNLKVSIPTIGLDMEHALERSPRAGCKLTTLAEIALGNETPMTALTSFTPSIQLDTGQKTNKCKQMKPSDVPEHFPPDAHHEVTHKPVTVSAVIDKGPPIKERQKSPSKEISPAAMHDSNSCMPIILKTPKNSENSIPKDIYEFDDSENTPISKAIQSPFKTSDDNDTAPKKPIIIPERPFKNIGMEEQEGIKFQKPETPAINDDNTTSTVTYSDRDDFVYGSISGGDEENEIENEDNKEENLNSAESSNSSAFTAKTFENKSLIMDRIFKNAKTKPKVPAEKPKLLTPDPPKQIPKQELDRLFDTLRGMNENRQANAAKDEKPENSSNTTRSKESQMGKKKSASSANKTAKSKMNASKSNNKVAVASKEERCSKEIAQLHAELGMSPAEIAELIGEGQRKSQRRCAVNRPKKLVEIWSSDEFEEFLSTKDIIALIEEKEQRTKRKRKTSTNGAKKTNPPEASSNNNTKGIDEEKTSRNQPEEEKHANNLPQKNLRNNSARSVATIENPKKAKTSKTKKKPTSACTTPAASSKVTAATRIQKEGKSSKSRRNSVDESKANNSPFKKPSQRRMPLKVADDSESDFETELHRRSRGTAGPLRNRRKTISGKLENDAGPTLGSSSATKKEVTKVKTGATPRNASNSKSPTTGESQTQLRPQARRKRIASEMLYYWSSSSDEEFGRIESTHDDEDHIDESENYQQHGWIVGDSHKKLVTLLAIAKGNKKVDDCGVKEANSKKKS